MSSYSVGPRPSWSFAALVSFRREPVGRGTPWGSEVRSSSPRASVRFGIAAITDTVDPFPTIADPMFFIGYGFMITGTVLFARLRAHQGGSNEGLIDALIVTASVAVVVWATLLAPYVRDGSVSSADRTINVIYSVFTVLLFAACTRLAVGPGAADAQLLPVGCSRRRSLPQRSAHHTRNDGKPRGQFERLLVPSHLRPVRSVGSPSVDGPDH